VPVIALFFGIRISMYWNDHDPPHFHAQYGDNKATVDIQRGQIMAGYLAGRQLKVVLAWTELRRDQLMQDWELARDGRPLLSIEGLQ
jgi:hypothetical protein